MKRILLITSLIFLIIAFTSFAIPKSFTSASDLDFKVQTITLINTVHQAPAVKIKNREDIANILELLSSNKYKRSIWQFFMGSPVGPDYALLLEGNNSKKKVGISFFSSLVNIDGQLFTTNKDVTSEVVSYLMSKNFALQAELSATQKVKKAIIEVSKNHGEDNPVIDLRADVTEYKFKPMYLIHLKGRFTNGSVYAANLYFSMMADCSQKWAYRATDENNRTLWEAVDL